MKDMLPDWTAEVWSAVESGAIGRELKDAVAGWPALSWQTVGRSVLDHVKAHVDELELLPALGGAWTKYRQLRQYADPKKHGPAETLFLSLRDHTVSVSHRPTLEILIGEQTVQKLEFEIALALALEGVVLRVQAARIREVLAGRCSGKCTLKCAGSTLLERSTKPVELPGISLGEGIAIPPP
jgi:hypothetical protein